MSKLNIGNRPQKHLRSMAWQRLRLIAATISRRNKRGNPNRVSTIWPAAYTAILIGSLLMVVLSYNMFDEWAIRSYRRVPKDLRAFFHFITGAGNSTWILIPSGLVCLVLLLVNFEFLSGKRRVWLSGILFDAWFLFVSVAGSGLISILIKRLVGRARPGSIDKLGFGYFDPFSFSGVFSSFPSGHSTTIAALSTMLALRFPKYWIIFAIVAVLVGSSRVILYKHYPSDIIMGLTIGVLFTLTLARIFANRNIGFRFVKGFKDGRGVLQRYIVRGIRG